MKQFRLVFVLALVLATAPLPARAAEAYDIHYVPTVGGATIRVEVWRNPALDPQPVLLTYSPYNSLGEPDPARDSLGARYVPRGYARAVADVLGTRGSTGCWDYGGRAEQQSGADVVRFLASLPWSSGSVGMIGGSYNGTTATMVAALGDEVPQLKAIVPIAAISRWYGYAYRQGVRYFLNSRVPTDEGFDTPLLFDVGFGDTVAADPTGPHFADTVRARAAECGLGEHTSHGYSRSPDYGPFWLERDYRKDAERFRAAVLLAHGWQDYNVKQEEAVGLWERIPVDDPETPHAEGVPLKLMVLTQASHSGATGGYRGWQILLDRFLERTLKGVDNGVEAHPPVITIGRDASGPAAEPRAERSWPPPGTHTLTLHLGRSFDTVPGVPSSGVVGTVGETGVLTREPNNDGGGWTHFDAPFVSEELTLNDPLNEDGHGYYSLYHKSEPLERDLRIAGSAVLDAWVRTAVPGQHLTPLLVDVLPDGTLKLVERGFLNLDYRNGLERAQPATGWMHARVEMLPQDYTFEAGHRIGLLLQSSNTVWALPGAAGLTSYANGPVAGVTPVGSRLLLPVVGGAPEDGGATHRR